MKDVIYFNGIFLFKNYSLDNRGTIIAFVLMPTLLSLLMTISGATSDEKVGLMTNHNFKDM